MREKEALDTQQRAAREVAGQPERQARHEDAIRVYLAGATYAESHPRAGRQTPATASIVVDEPAQPVDEPAPLAQSAATRR